jgi:hypothetical protein
MCLESVYVPASVEIIDFGAFANCTALTEVTFAPDSRLIVIDGFFGCMRLYRIEIPASVRIIGFSKDAEGFLIMSMAPFSECEALTEVIFAADSHLQVINGFQVCPSLCRLEIPTTVEQIGSTSFSTCKALREVTFAAPSRLQVINGFQECRALCRVEIPASVVVITEESFSECRALTEVIFAPESCLRVINGFQECRSLHRVEIPASVEEIESWSFSDCRALTEVIFATGSRLRTMNAFQGCTSLYRLDIPASVERMSSSEGDRYEGYAYGRELSVRELRLPSGTRIRSVHRNDHVRGFITFDDEKDVKIRRRQVHQWLAGFRR